MVIQQKKMFASISTMFILTIVLMLFLDSYLKNAMNERLSTELQRLSSSALQALLTAVDSADAKFYDNLADRLGTASEVRITFIDQTGLVLGDSNVSSKELENLENHLARPEVQQAIKTGAGLSRRYSSTVKQDMFYFAVSNEKEQRETFNSDVFYIARASLPESSISDTLFSMRLGIGSIAFFGLVCISFFMSRILANVASGNTRLLENQVATRTKEISLLQSLSSYLNACKTMEEAENVIKTILPQLLPNISGSVFLIKSSRNRLDLMASWGEKKGGRERFDPDECWALRRGYRHFSKTGQVDIPCAHIGELENLHTLCIPLVAQGDTIGIVEVIYNENEIEDDLEQLLISISEQLGLGLANLRLRDDLRQQAIRDPLTDLYNRRYLMESVERVLYRNQRQKTNTAIVMLDLDYFKRFNDTFGHDAGDYVLKQIAGEIKQSIRGSDIPCRYGGEEFCIVYTDTDKDTAVKLAQKLCDRIRSLDMNFNNLSLGQVSASLGLAVFPEHGRTLESLLKGADDALYLAKENGRDQVVIAGAPNIVSEVLKPESKVANK